MTRRVVVTGIGLVTPLGTCPRTVHRALCDGESALRRPSGFALDGLGDVVAAEIADFDAVPHLGRKGLRGMDRGSRLTAVAAFLALAAGGRIHAKDDRPEGCRAEGEVGLVLGTMLSGVRTISQFDRRAVSAGPSYAKPMDFANTVINAAAGQTAIRLGLTGINATVSAGTASGLQAIGYAADLIRDGRADTLLAGGMDELSWETLLAFNGAGLLAGDGNGGQPVPIPFERRRNGLALGEAAAFLLLEERTVAVARKAEILGEIRGHGSAYDLSRRRDPKRAAEAVARAVRLALDDASLDVSEVEVLSVSANGCPRGDLEEALGLQAALDGRCRALPVTAPKAALGESLGASGVLATALLLTALRDGRLPGVAGLVEPEAALPYSPLRATSRGLEGRRGLVHARGLDGKTAALAIESAENGAAIAGESA